MGVPIGLSVIWILIYAIEYIGDNYGGGVLFAIVFAIFGVLLIFSPKYDGKDGPLSCVT